MSERPDMDVSDDIVSDWADDFSSLWEQAGRCFRRCDTRRHAEGYVRGLLGRIDRKNGWQMAEYLGASSPYSIQHLLGRSNWNADAVREVRPASRPEFRHLKENNPTRERGGGVKFWRA